MAVVNLNRDSFLIDDGNDAKVIIRDLADIPGGRALDVTGWDDDVIRAGHIIKKDSTTGEYAPLGISDGAYVELGDDEVAVGVLKTSILKSKPFGAIMTMGEVNAAAAPYPVTESLASALPHIYFHY